MTSKLPCRSSTARQLAGMLFGTDPGTEQDMIIDWDVLLDLATKGKVSQMLYSVVRAQGIPLTASIAERLRSIHLSGVADSAKRQHQFEKILEALTSAGIVVIPVKGVWLSEVVYPNIAMRGMADIDLWIQREDLDCAVAVMKTIGFQRALSDVNRPQELQEELLGETLFLKQGAHPVELHWRIFRGEWLRHAASVDERVIRNRALFFKSEMVRQLQPEDAFIHVAIHLVVNRQMSSSALRTTIDLHMIHKNLNIDWRQIVDRAKTWGLATPVWLACYTLLQMSGDDRNLMALINNLQPSPVRRFLFRKIVLPGRVASGLDLSQGVKKFVYQLLLIDRPGAVVQLVMQSIWPDRTWLTLRYGLKNAPLWRIALQRLLHPLLVIWHRKH